MTTFFASPEFLDIVRDVYFPTKRTRIADIEVEGQVYRMLVVGRRERPITAWFWLDYHAPLAPSEVRSPRKRDIYIPYAVKRIVPIPQWDPAREGHDPEHVAPFIDWSLFPSFEAYRASLKDGPRAQFKRIWRVRERLEKEHGPLVFQIHDPDEQALDQSFAWKAVQLRATNRLPLFDRPENVAFFKELGRRGILRASTLRTREGRLLSSWLGYVYDGVWSGWIFTYDHDPIFKKFSVGWQVMEKVLEASYREGNRGFDFSVGQTDYKFAYGTHVRVLGSVGRPSAVRRLVRVVRSHTTPFLERHPEIASTISESAQRLRQAVLFRK